MTIDGPTRIIVADASVLINLLHVDRVETIASVARTSFCLPDEVKEEIRVPEQRARLEVALEKGWMEIATIEDMKTLELFVELYSSRRFGAGESACLALAVRNDWVVAADERGAFRREVETRLGPDRLVNTPGLILMAIRAGRLTVEEADAIKATLEGRRFRMKFASFRELL